MVAQFLWGVFYLIELHFRNIAKKQIQTLEMRQNLIISFLRIVQTIPLSPYPLGPLEDLENFVNY